MLRRVIEHQNQQEYSCPHRCRRSFLCVECFKEECHVSHAGPLLRSSPATRLLTSLSASSLARCFPRLAPSSLRGTWMHRHSGALERGSAHIATPGGSERCTYLATSCGTVRRCGAPPQTAPTRSLDTPCCSPTDSGTQRPPQ